MAAKPALELLRIAQAILTGTPIAKAEGEDTTDPDALQPGSDPRAGGAAPTDDSLSEARDEAQSGQQPAAGENMAPGAPGAAGAASPGAPSEGTAHEAGETSSEESDEHANGEEEPDEVTKADIIQSMQFFAKSNGIKPDEIVKAFSGLEGNPAKGTEPVGKGVEFLEQISIAIKDQGKVLDAIAGALLDLSKSQVKLGGDVAKSLASSEAAVAAAEEAKTRLAKLPRLSDALPAKGMGGSEIVKAEGSDRPLTGQDLFQMALKGQLNPLDAAKLNRQVNDATTGAANRS